MSVFGPYLDEVTAPGARMEIVEEVIGGVRLRTFRDRPRHLSFLIDRSTRYEDREFLVQGDARLTYGEAMMRALRLAEGLRTSYGVSSGDRIGILGSNAVDWVVAFWAAIALDAIVVPFNAWWTAEELEFGIEDSNTEVMLADARRATVAIEAGLASHRVVVWGDEPRPGGTRTLDDCLADEPLDRTTVLLRGEDAVAGIFYTSGTTGRPKGSANTHRNVIANLQNVTAFFRAVGARKAADEPKEEAAPKSQDSDLTVIPLFHTTALMSTMIPYVYAGHRLVFMPPGRFDPEVAAQLIHSEQVTRFGGVPTIVNRIIESGAARHADFSSVKSISYGGAPASPALLEKIQRAFPSIRERVVQGYGLTETSPLLTLNVGTDYFERPGSVGVPLPTVELRIADAAGNPLPPGTAGEIWARGPNVIQGYWNRPEVNTEMFIDGFFRTGDIGYRDDEGFLYITDRLKDVVIRGGENVYCVEVESVLEAHPSVHEAAVVGVPHEDLGEEVKAIVVPEEGHDVDEDALAAHAALHLAPFKVPSVWEVRALPLPRNPSGKVLKQALRDGEPAVFAVGSDTDSAL